MFTRFSSFAMYFHVFQIFSAISNGFQEVFNDLKISAPACFKCPAFGSSERARHAREAVPELHGGERVHAKASIKGVHFGGNLLQLVQRGLRAPCHDPERAFINVTKGRKLDPLAYKYSLWPYIARYSSGHPYRFLVDHCPTPSVRLVHLRHGKAGGRRSGLRLRLCRLHLPIHSRSLPREAIHINS